MDEIVIQTAVAAQSIAFFQMPLSPLRHFKYQSLPQSVFVFLFFFLQHASTEPPPPQPTPPPQNDALMVSRQPYALQLSGKCRRVSSDSAEIYSVRTNDDKSLMKSRSRSNHHSLIQLFSSSQTSVSGAKISAAVPRSSEEQDHLTFHRWT